MTPVLRASIQHCNMLCSDFKVHSSTRRYEINRLSQHNLGQISIGNKKYPTTSNPPETVRFNVQICAE